MIETLITVAFILYLLAFYIIKYTNYPWWVHIVVACIAFGLDAIATGVMVYHSHLQPISNALLVHRGLSIAALMLFFIQAGLGLSKRIKLHGIFAKWVFLPIWTLSMLSGFLFLLNFNC